MRALLLMLVFCLPATASAEEIRFRPLHIYIDSGAVDLAAYQLELKVKSGQSEIVGVEGGAHPSFVKPPYYDPAALRGGRIILAAFSISSNLPRGNVRMLTIHVQETGGPVEYGLELMAAADPNGKPIAARVFIGKEQNER